jgi:hypothetical protein
MQHGSAVHFPCRRVYGFFLRRAGKIATMVVGEAVGETENHCPKVRGNIE